MPKFTQGFKEQLKEFVDDVKVIADEKKDSVFDAARDAIVKANDVAEEAKLKAQKKMLAPIFPQDLTAELQPQMIRICEPDKQHLSSPVCEGSIGYLTETSDMTVLNIYADYKGLLGVKFYPYDLEDVYYIDPANSKAYICLDEYFSYLKKVRVDELTRIAQELGAKKIKVSINAEKKTFVGEQKKGKFGLGKLGNTNYDHDVHSKAYEKVEVAAEVRFKGQEPSVPKLEYFKNDRDIKSLIAMRMHSDNPLQSKTITMDFSNSSGMNRNDAIKIESALKKLKLGGNASVVSAVEEENRQHFEYFIDFSDEE